MEIDKIIHEPVRLRIMMMLSGVGSADFKFLLNMLSATKGNLSRHMEKLESANYVKVKKSFKDRIPNTSYQLTKKGDKALVQYWKKLDIIRQTGKT